MRKKENKLTYSLAAVSLIGAIAFFVLGLIYPIMSTKSKIWKITLDYQEIRLFDSVKLFYESGDLFLAFIILFFTIIFPIVKFIDLAVRLFNPKSISTPLMKFLQKMDKWSMLDVFLVALLLLNFKMNTNFIVMDLKIGTSYIAISVILRMISSQLLSTR